MLGVFLLQICDTALQKDITKGRSFICQDTLSDHHKRPVREEACSFSRPISFMRTVQVFYGQGK